MTDSTSYYPLQAENGAEASAEDMQAGVQAPPGHGVDPTIYTPYSNTGCTFHKPPESLPPHETPLLFGFDWYQATLDKEVEPLTALQWAQYIGESIPGRPRNGYEVCHDFGQATVSYGGETGVHGVHIKIGGGDACGDMVAYIRQSFPIHRVSRVDVFVDFRGPDAWEVLKDIVIKAAQKHGVRTSTFGDWLEGKRGRTLYVNAREKGKEAPTYSARLYEKGYQMRACKHIPDAPLDWVRLEFEIHPPKHTRHVVATLTPDQLARSSKWMRSICDAIGAAQVERVKISTRRIKPPVVQAVETMFRQYAGTVREAKRDSWVDRAEWMQACADLWDREAFGGLPASVRASYMF